MINNMKVSVIIPAHNEGDIIGETLEYIEKEWVDEIIVVNDGSTDNTSEIVKEYQVSLIKLEKNIGKGAAVTEGILKSTGDILILIDADLGKSIVEIRKLVNPIIEEDIDVVIGIIPIIGGGLGILRKLADISLKKITGKKMKAPLSGQRAIKRKVIEDILPLKNGFALEMGINIAILKNNIKFKEVDCLFSHRVSGQDIAGYWHRFEQLIDILKYLWELKKEEYV